MKDIKNFITETNDNIPQRIMEKEGCLQKTDVVKNALKEVSKILANEYSKQQEEEQGKPNNYRHDLYFDLLEELFNTANEVCKQYVPLNTEDVIR